MATPIPHTPCKLSDNDTPTSPSAPSKPPRVLAPFSQPPPLRAGEFEKACLQTCGPSVVPSGASTQHKLRLQSASRVTRQDNSIDVAEPSSLGQRSLSNTPSGRTANACDDVFSTTYKTIWNKTKEIDSGIIRLEIPDEDACDGIGDVHPEMSRLVESLIDPFSPSSFLEVTAGQSQDAYETGTEVGLESEAPPIPHQEDEAPVHVRTPTRGNRERSDPEGTLDNSPITTDSGYGTFDSTNGSPPSLTTRRDTVQASARPSHGASGSINARATNALPFYNPRGPSEDLEEYREAFRLAQYRYPAAAAMFIGNLNASYTDIELMLEIHKIFVPVDPELTVEIRRRFTKSTIKPTAIVQFRTMAALRRALTYTRNISGRRPRLRQSDACRTITYHCPGKSALSALRRTPFNSEQVESWAFDGDGYLVVTYKYYNHYTDAKRWVKKEQDKTISFVSKGRAVPCQEWMATIERERPDYFGYWCRYTTQVNLPSAIIAEPFVQ